MVVKEALEHNEFLGKDTATVVPFHSFLSVTSTRDKQHAVLVLPPSSCVAGCPALVWCWSWPLALARPRGHLIMPAPANAAHVCTKV
jgi:hypothetical protein